VGAERVDHATVVGHLPLELADTYALCPDDACLVADDALLVGDRGLQPPDYGVLVADHGVEAVDPLVEDPYDTVLPADHRMGHSR
jgi:hypothetical protein